MSCGSSDIGARAICGRKTASAAFAARPRSASMRSNSTCTSASDGEVVVIHDPLLERTTSGSGPVSDHTLEALQRLRLRDSIAETIPTLAQTLDLFAPTGLEPRARDEDRRPRLPYPGLVEKTVALVEARGMAGRVRLTCFVPEVLEDMRAASRRAIRASPPSTGARPRCSGASSGRSGASSISTAPSPSSAPCSTSSSSAAVRMMPDGQARRLGAEYTVGARLLGSASRSTSSPRTGPISRSPFARTPGTRRRQANGEERR